MILFHLNGIHTPSKYHPYGCYYKSETQLVKLHRQRWKRLDGGRDEADRRESTQVPGSIGGGDISLIHTTATPIEPGTVDPGRSRKRHAGVTARRGRHAGSTGRRGQVRPNMRPFVRACPLAEPRLFEPVPWWRAVKLERGPMEKYSGACATERQRRWRRSGG